MAHFAQRANRQRNDANTAWAHAALTLMRANQSPAEALATYIWDALRRPLLSERDQFAHAHSQRCCQTTEYVEAHVDVPLLEAENEAAMNGSGCRQPFLGKARRQP
jgi:hypothetical protein